MLETRACVESLFLSFGSAQVFRKGVVGIQSATYRRNVMEGEMEEARWIVAGLRAGFDLFGRSGEAVAALHPATAELEARYHVPIPKIPSSLSGQTNPLLSGLLLQP